MEEKLKFLLKQLYPSVLERGQRMYNVSGTKIVIKEETDDFVLLAVPSEVKPAPYLVSIHFKAEAAVCDCPYFKENKQPCKHIASAYFKLLEIPETVEVELPQKALNDSVSANQASAYSLDFSFSKYDAINFSQIDIDIAAEKLAKSSFQELSKMMNSLSKSMEILLVTERLLKFQVFSNWSSYHLELVRHPEGLVASCSCKNYSNVWCPHTWYVLLEIVNHPENRLLEFITDYNLFFKNDIKRFKLDVTAPNFDPNNYFDIIFKNGKLVSIYKDKSVNILDEDMDWQKYTSIMPQLDLNFIPTSTARSKKNNIFHAIYLWTDLKSHPKSSSFKVFPYAVKLNKSGQYSKTLKEFNTDFIAKYYSNIVDYNFHDEIIQDLKGISDGAHSTLIIEKEEDFLKRNNVLSSKRDYVTKELKHEYNRKIVMNVFSKLKGKENYINLHKRDAEDIHSYTAVKLNSDQISLGINIKEEKNYIMFQPYLYKEDKQFPLTALFTNYFVLDDNTLFPIKAYDSLIIQKLFKEVDNLKWMLEDWNSIFENLVKPLQEYLKINIEVNLPIPVSKTISCEFSAKVYLKEYETGLLIVPAFCYQMDDFYKEVNMDGGLIAHHFYNNDTYKIERDPILESDMEQMIRALHPNFENQVTEHYFNLSEDKVLENNWLFKVFNVFNKNNIEILGQKTLKNYNYNSNNPTIRLKSGSGIDWFDIEIKVSFGTQVLKLTELRNAILNNQQYVRLGDGTIGVLPEEWIAKYSSLFKLGKVNKEKLELNQFQLTAIDEYISEIDNNEQIFELQKKIANLQNFREIKAIPLPTNMSVVLRDYQVNGFHWLRFLHEYRWGGCLADDMGLGKTVQVLTFLQSLINENKDFKALVVVPTSLIFNWENEILKFTPTIKYLLHTGMERTKTTEVFDKFQIIITSYGLLRRDIDMFKSYEFDYAILDESQAIKNPLSQISKGVRVLRTKNRLVMTGTPVENSTFDLYAQLDFANPGMLGSLESFKTNFASKIDNEQDEFSAAKLRKIIYPFVLNRKKEIVAKELPEKTEVILYCEMDVIQRKIYDTYKVKIKEEIREAIEQQGLNRAGLYILKGLTKLRQLCNHPALLSEEDFSKSSSIKMKLLFEHLEELLENNKKVLVFSFFSSMLDLVEKKMIDKHYQYVKITGETKDRKGKVEEFQNNEDTKVFLISLKAGGTGLNLTAAEYVFLIDPWWNPAVEQQAIDRTHRIGQDKHIIAYKMICKDTIEEKILQLQIKKKAIADDLINIESGLLKKLTKDDVMDLIG